MAQRQTIERGAVVKERGDDRLLRAAAVVFAAGFLVHNADHMRRGVGTITAQVLGGGVVVSIAAVAALALVVMRHRAAPLVAVVVGFATVVAVSASHLLPHWSSFSDAFPGGNVDGFSWFAVTFELVGALLLGLAGLEAARRRS